MSRTGGISAGGIGVVGAWFVAAAVCLLGAAGAAWWVVVVAAACVAAMVTAWWARRTMQEGSERLAAAKHRRERRREKRGRVRDERRAILGVLDGVDAPVAAIDAQGMVTLANREAARLFGRRGESPVGLAVDDLFGPGDLGAMCEQAQRGVAARRRVKLVRQGAARVFDVSALPVEGTGGRFGVVLMLQDVTELARAMQLKTDFVANASHELRTPLAAIRGAVDTLADAPDDEALRTRLTTMIAQNAARLEDLVRDLLDLSRLESPEAGVEVSQLDVEDVGKALGAMFEQALRARSLRMEVNIDPSVRTVETDRRLLELILKNLVDNACKFAREGTAIRIAARPAQGLEGVRFEVIDEGIGIPMQHQERIFERFYQVDASRSGWGGQRGTGLGLAIVKHAVRNLGGTVGVESVWQQGTTVWFEIPARVADAGEATR